ncbi:MAG: class I SAM-dependent RNA methyltransferase, partial [Pseudomonadota bacterium]
RPTLTMPAASRRRIALTARRTKKGAAIGFHRGQSDEIIAVAECAVARPGLVEAMPRLVELVQMLASRKGELRLTLVETPEGVDCAVTGAKPLDGPARALLAGATTRAGLARLSVEGEPVVTRAAPTERLGRAEVLLPPGGFLQPSAEGAAALVALVEEALDLATLKPRRKGLAKLADLFSGIGTFALPLAEQADVDAFELEAPALSALERGWRAAGVPGRVRGARRNLFHRPLVGPELEPYDAVVIDPPRAGARAQAEALAASEVGRIASVSCSPATFARDARLLIDGGYRLLWVAPVDQFRWSPHLELVGAFRRGE